MGFGLRTRVLYVTTNGVTEPHVASQVLPYLTRLGSDHEFTLLTFEKPSADPAAQTRTRESLEEAGIRWVHGRFHGAPFGTLRDVLAGRRVIAREVRRHGVQLIHARSYVAAEMARPVARRLGVPWIFDMRGFYIDERVDGGLLRAGSPWYRVLKRLERRLLGQSDAIVVLTDDAKRALAEPQHFEAPTVPVAVVPCGVDLAEFSPAKEPFPDGAFRACYTGSLGSFYDEEGMARAFAHARKLHPEARFHIASPQSPATLLHHLAKAGVSPDRVVAERLAPGQVVGRLRASNAGICFLWRTFAKRAASPIKVAEYLATGLPVLVTPGAGDYAEFVEQERVGVVVDPADDAALRTAVERWVALAADPATPHRCRRVAEKRYDVDAGTRTYRRLYEGLLRAT